MVNVTLQYRETDQGMPPGGSLITIADYFHQGTQCRWRHHMQSRGLLRAPRDS